jgi:hypothetical protein
MNPAKGTAMKLNPTLTETPTICGPRLAAADVAGIKAAILKPNNPYSPLDLAKAIIHAHDLELEREECFDTDGSDVSWWVAELMPEARGRVQVTAVGDGLWAVYSDIENDGDLTPKRAREAAALLNRAADIADEINERVAA